MRSLMIILSYWWLNMIKAGKLRLLPTKEQELLFFSFCNISRFAYNESLSFKISMYNDGIFVGVQECIDHIKDLKYSEEYSWIKLAPEAVTKQAIRDMNRSFTLFFKRGNKGFPKYKKKFKTRPSFYQRTDRFYQIDEKHVRITGIKQPVKCIKTQLPNKIVNTRVIYDGKYWFLTYSYYYEAEIVELTDEVLGVDLGVRNMATCSDGRIFKNINKEPRIIKLEKRKKLIQRKIARKYKCNSRKSNNIIKLENDLRTINRKIFNIRNNYLHCMTKELVRNKPKAIVIEDLSVCDMAKTKLLNRYIYDANFSRIRKYLEYKTNEYGIKLVIADRYYPSTKKCSCCGNIIEKMSLDNRIYECKKCGMTMDRDLNASINLKNYYC